MSGSDAKFMKFKMRINQITTTWFVVFFVVETTAQFVRDIYYSTLGTVSWVQKRNGVLLTNLVIIKHFLKKNFIGAINFSRIVC